MKKVAWLSVLVLTVVSGTAVAAIRVDGPESDPSGFNSYTVDDYLQQHFQLFENQPGQPPSEGPWRTDLAWSVTPGYVVLLEQPGDQQDVSNWSDVLDFTASDYVLYWSDPSFLNGNIDIADVLSRDNTLFVLEVGPPTVVTWNSGYYNDTFAVFSDKEATVPEPSTLIIWSILGGLGITVGWLRKRKAA